jgi:hypothetical protein
LFISEQRVRAFRQTMEGMPLLLASQPSTSEPVADAAALTGLATCPGCHFTEPSLTMVAVSAGASWRCVRCTQQWNATRLATVSAYMLWMSRRDVSPVDPARFDQGALTLTQL